MRYRNLNSPDDFSRDVAMFVDLIGQDEYRSLLTNLGNGLNHKGYVTETDDLRFSLELQLLNLELIRASVSGHFQGSPKHLHEAADFVIGVGQTIPHLSDQAQAKLRGQIIGGLKTNGLRPLQHEMRVAGMLSKFGCEVSFSDLEGGGGYDFLAERNGTVYEVEAKSLPVFSGQAILPQDADKFFLEVRQGFKGWNDNTQVPILNVVAKTRLPSRRSDLVKLVDACNAAAAVKQTVTVEGGFTVKFLASVPNIPHQRLALAARMDGLLSGINVYVSEKDPKVVIRLFSERRRKFAQNIISTIADASKRQFSSHRPGVIWVHVDYISPAVFDALAFANDGLSFFDTIALAVFSSPKRSHIIQLVFTGGAHLVERDGYAVSSFRRAVYDSPNSIFNVPMLFPEGKRRSEPAAPLSEASINALSNLAIMPDHSAREIALLNDLVNRLGSATDLPSRERVASALFNKGLLLGTLGRSGEAIAAYDDLIDRLGSAIHPPLRELLAKALVNKGCTLGYTERAIQVFDDVIARFNCDADLELREQIAKALVNKGSVLGALTRYQEAIDVFDNILVRFGSDSEPQLRTALAYAFLGKVRSLRELGRKEEAIAVFEDMRGRFKSSKSPLSELVAQAESLL